MENLLAWTKIPVSLLFLIPAAKLSLLLAGEVVDILQAHRDSCH